MNILKVISHPYLIIISFFAIMISGQHSGGFYILYILLALPHGGVHALLALFGVVLLAVSYNKFDGKSRSIAGSVINIAGLVLLILSLFFFFYGDKGFYNISTFYQFVPLTTLVIFGVLSVVFFVVNVKVMFDRRLISDINRKM